MISYRTQDIKGIQASEIAAKAAEMAKDGYRLEQICAMSKDGVTELLYSFDKDLELTNFKLTVPEDMTISSISGSYWPAFIYENEIHDLFGVTFTDLVLDYHGNFYRISSKTPWKTEKKKEGA